MAPERANVRRKASASKGHALRVRLVRKSQPVHNMGKTKFQRILFKDEKGEKLRLTLFGVNIGFYESILQEDMVYDISDAVIKDGNSSSPYPQEKQLFLKNSTSVLLVGDSDSVAAFQPQYVSLADVDCAVVENQTFDCVVAVVKVEGFRNIETKTGRFVDTCKIQIVDDSWSEVCDVTLWEAMAQVAQQIDVLDIEKCVVALYGVKLGFFRGERSLSGGFESRIVMSPQGSRADAVRKWMAESKDIISEKVVALEKATVVAPVVELSSIGALYALKADAIEKGSLMKINAYVHEFENRDVRSSACCGFCGKACNVQLLKRFECEGCGASTVASARLYFDFKATDGTGSIFLSAQTRTAENMLGIKAHILHSKSAEERASFLADAKSSLRHKKLPLIVTPCTSMLVDHGIVNWLLKYMETT